MKNKKYSSMFSCSDRLSPTKNKKIFFNVNKALSKLARCNSYIRTHK
jgi:hypothetical protein